MLLYLLVKICRFYHQNSVFVVLMLNVFEHGEEYSTNIFCVCFSI